MAQQKITVRRIDALRARAQREKRALFLWDDGFGCRATASGKVSWYVQKWFQGRGAQRIRIGHYPSMTIDEAKGYASGFINKADAEKKDFTTQRRDTERARRKQLEAPTLEAAVNRYLEHHKDKWRPSYYREVERKFQNEVYPEIKKDTRLPDIAEADLRKIVNAKRDAGHHVAARYMFVVLRPFFRWCVDELYCDASPLGRIKCPKPPKDRDRILSDDEVKAFWSAANQLTGAYDLYRPFYKLLLLTAQRREEVGAMKWSEIKDGVWEIPGERTKNHKAHTVHLSPQALAILEEVPKRGEYVFSVKGHKGEASISGYSKAKVQLDSLMKGPAWRVHDLRRTAASGMARLGIQPYIVDRVLNHISDAERGMVRIYQRHKYLEERKRALEAWGSYVQSIVLDTTVNQNILSFRRTSQSS